jgi:hypothetical protein
VSQLNYSIGIGENDYVACIIAPAPPTGRDKSAFRTPGLRVLDLADPLPPAGVQVNVPAGAPQVVACLRNAEGNFPANVTVTVTLPDSTVLDTSTEPYDPTTVVQMQGDSISDLLISNPQAGDWTIQMESTNDEDEYQFFFSTLPTSDVQNTIDATLSSMADADAMEALAVEEGLDGGSWGCFWCKVGCAALGVVLVALLTLGASYVTAGAAPIVALAGFLGVSAVAAVRLVLTAATAIGASVAICIAYICTWAHACSQPRAAVTT